MYMIRYTIVSKNSCWTLNDSDSSARLAHLLNSNYKKNKKKSQGECEYINTYKTLWMEIVYRVVVVKMILVVRVVVVKIS